jgi:hypothetical protein
MGGGGDGRFSMCVCRPEELAEIVIGSGGKHNAAEIVLLGGIGVLDKTSINGC